MVVNSQQIVNQIASIPSFKNQYTAPPTPLVLHTKIYSTREVKISHRDPEIFLELDLTIQLVLGLPEVRVRGEAGF